MRRERLTGAELEGYLRAVTAALVRDLEPERIVLFGSFARGDQNRASDLDLVLIAATPLPFCERIDRALESAYAASIPAAGASTSSTSRRATRTGSPTGCRTTSTTGASPSRRSPISMP